MSPIGIFHIIFAILSLVSGAGVLLRAKGTRSHKRIGYAYVACMLAMNASALMIYRLFGGFGPFHVLALVSLVTLFLGVVPAVRRRPGWLKKHYGRMSWSYVGLCAAFAAEIIVRTPAVRGLGVGFGIAVLVASSLVLLVGGTIIVRQRTDALAGLSE